MMVACQAAARRTERWPTLAFGVRRRSECLGSRRTRQSATVDLARQERATCSTCGRTRHAAGATSSGRSHISTARRGCKRGRAMCRTRPTKWRCTETRSPSRRGRHSTGVSSSPAVTGTTASLCSTLCCTHTSWRTTTLWSSRWRPSCTLTSPRAPSPRPTCLALWPRGTRRACRGTSRRRGQSGTSPWRRCWRPGSTCSCATRRSCCSGQWSPSWRRSPLTWPCSATRGQRTRCARSASRPTPASTTRTARPPSASSCCRRCGAG
mmetsp:Transcript_28790/g.92566  ORF Transcript_28790/g.92566 Transcript_28790/m.92566 type:complete len:266 (+) Transcript_28790:89-886(+)